MQTSILMDLYDIIVTTSSDVVGVNFFNECHLILTDYPKDYYDQEQLYGRTQRMNVLGKREVTYILEHGKTLDEEKLKWNLIVKLNAGK